MLEQFLKDTEEKTGKYYFILINLEKFSMIKINTVRGGTGITEFGLKIFKYLDAFQVKK